MRQTILSFLAAALLPGIASATPCEPASYEVIFEGSITLTNFIGASTDPADGDFFQLSYVPCSGETALDETNLYEWRVLLTGQGSTLWSDAVILENQVTPLQGVPRTAAFSFNDPGTSAFSFLFNPLSFDTDVDFAYFGVGPGLIGYDIFNGTQSATPQGSLNLVAIPFGNNAPNVPGDIDGFWTPTVRIEPFADPNLPDATSIPNPATGGLLLLALAAMAAVRKRHRHEG